MQAPTRRGLFAGLFLVGVAVVLLGVTLTRLAVILFGVHYGWCVSFLAPLGAGIGGLVAFVARQMARRDRLVGGFALTASLGAALSVVAVLVLMHVSAVIDHASLAEVAKLFVVGVAVALPFGAAGALVASALRAEPAEAPGVFASTLVGLAAGVGAVFVGLDQGAMRLALMAALVFALAGVVLYFVARRAGERSLRGGLVATFALCSMVLVAGDVGAPWLKLSSGRWTNEKPDFQAWSDVGLLTVDKPLAGQSLVRTEGTFARPMLEAKTQPVAQPDDLGYVLTKEKGPTLILGAGGGRDIRVAAKSLQKDIYVAEPNPLLVEDALAGKYKVFVGDLWSRPEVHLTLSDARSYVRRSPYSYRNIILGAGDEATMLATGALVFGSNPALTVDAIEDDLAHLLPEGVLVATRAEIEFDRLLEVVTAGLQRVGAPLPRAHMFACSFNHQASLLAKRSPLSKLEISTLRRQCQRSKFTEIFSPDDVHGKRREAIVSGKSVGDGPLPTDDRPTELSAIPPVAWASIPGDAAAMFSQQQGIVVLALGVLGAGFLAGIAHLVALLIARRRAATAAPTLRSMSFFAATGAGIALTVTSVGAQFTTLLGHPVYVVSALLIGLALFGAVGSVLGGRVAASADRSSSAWRAEILVMVLAALAATVRWIIDVASPLPFEARFAVALLLVAPLGVLAGMQGSLAVKLFARRAAELPWLLGVAATAGAFATIAGMVFALQLGTSALWLAAGWAWFIAAIAAPTPAPLPVVLVTDPPAPVTPEPARADG